jgi:diguanylate cyclase (GGDEF)-like protein
MASTNRILHDNVILLKSRASRYAIQGLIIGAAAIIVATLLVTLFQQEYISIAGIINAQNTNLALWFLDLMPFAFAFWGQYVNSIIAYEAGAMVADQTSELRLQTENLVLQARRDATYDHLTGLPNRVLLLDRMQQALTVVRKEHIQVALMILDLSAFKDINNTLGRLKGDLLLKQVALRLQGVVSKPATVARIGADEFGILLTTRGDAVNAQHIAENIHKAVESPLHLDEMNLDMSMAIGISIFPEHGDDVDKLSQRAEIALEVAKQRGGSATVVYSPGLDKYSTRRLTLMGQLRSAIEQNQLVLQYQPKINASDMSMHAVEALVRWQHPEYGMIMPDEFISLAERNGMIKPLTYWVLGEALRQCAEWHNNGTDIAVAVNVAANVMLDPELPDIVVGMLAAHDVRSEWLILEITESTLMADETTALEIITRLNEIGVRISIDDFGTGYSSLSYFKTLPVDELKIDMSFVLDMLENEKDAVIVRAIIGLAHSLGLQVIAEGVQSEAIMHRLQQMNCDMLQGFYLSRPVDSRQIMDQAGVLSAESDQQVTNSKTEPNPAQ